MKISIKAFNRQKYFDVALDEDSGTYLLGIPFYHGPAEHTNYYVISKTEFEHGLSDPSSLNDLVDGQTFKGKGQLFFSTFIGLRQECKMPATRLTPTTSQGQVLPVVIVRDFFGLAT